MHASSCAFRLSLLAAASLVVAPVAPARAQSPAPPQTGAPTDQTPPTRAGRLARMSGTVTHHGPEETTWSPAVLNYPVSTGDAFWTEPSAQAEIELSGNRILM